eukprot:GHVU01111432.1.p1 GENE.GHVU01111432.1~~GHVU01111432.1.p1  ORF type:complete len:229 (-),score=14.93 GHVU01111432.1:61-747(-)
MYQWLTDQESTHRLYDRRSLHDRVSRALPPCSLSEKRINVGARPSITRLLPHTHTHTHTHTRTCTQISTLRRTHTDAHTDAHTRAHTQTHMELLRRLSADAFVPPWRLHTRPVRRREAERWARACVGGRPCTHRQTGVDGQHARTDRGGQWGCEAPCERDPDRPTSSAVNCDDNRATFEAVRKCASEGACVGTCLRAVLLQPRQSVNRSLPPSLTHSLTHSLPHSLTH